MVAPDILLTVQNIYNKTAMGTVQPLAFVPSYYEGEIKYPPAMAVEYYFDKEVPWGSGKVSYEDAAFNYLLIKLDRRVGDEVGYWTSLAYNEEWNGLPAWHHIGYTSELTEGQVNPVTSDQNTIESVDRYTYNGIEALLMKTDVDTGPGQIGGKCL